tara:strand:- start:883 stop:1467 length:585 start_codon:yes stop_codon:yes gene_type:complete
MGNRTNQDRVEANFIDEAILYLYSQLEVSDSTPACVKERLVNDKASRQLAIRQRTESLRRRNEPYDSICFVPPEVLLNSGEVDRVLKRPHWWMPYVTRHAVDRYREHFSGVDYPGILWDLVHGEELDQALASSLMGRNVSTSNNSIYIAGQNQQGIFVMQEPSDTEKFEKYSTIVVTYIRLGLRSQDILQGNYA